MNRPRVAFWVRVQVAAIALLLVGALAAIWGAGADAVERDRRRGEALRTLARADDALAIGGARGLTIVPDWPDTLEAEEWDSLDAWLSEQSARALAPTEGVEGGFYVPDFDRYVGRSGADRTLARAALPARDRDLIEDQVRQALARDRPVASVIEGVASAVAVRAAPARVNGRRVAATWAVLRLGQEGSPGRSVRSYQWATGFALSGLAMAGMLTGLLTSTLRKMAADNSQLEADIRRKERLAALGTLVAGVSHEMRNPLAGLRSSAQLWQRGVVSDDELAAELIGEVDRLEAIVGHLLAFSRAEPRSMDPCDLNEVAAEAARLARPAAEAQGVEVDSAFSADPALARMDPAAILQVARNLTTNALQAMPGGGRMTISTGRDPGSGGWRLAVADTGPGLAPETAARLFEPFFTTKAEGTGLGLAIAREIALAHGGEIRADRARGGGAEFVVILPPVAEGHRS